MTALTIVGSMLLIAHAPDPDLAKLEGSWRVLSLTADGKEFPRDEVQEGRYSFRDGELSVPEPGNPENRYPFTVDSRRSPKAIDLTVPGGRDKAKKFECIYKLEDDRLTICFPQGKQESSDLSRPMGFDGGRGRSLVVLERIGDR